MSAFGTTFKMVNKARQPLRPQTFGPGWTHLATFSRGLQEYCCFQHQTDGKVYIERLNPSNPNLFEAIASDSEWDDCFMWLVQQQILYVKVGGEFFVATP